MVSVAACGLVRGDIVIFAPSMSWLPPQTFLETGALLLAFVLGEELVHVLRQLCLFLEAPSIRLAKDFPPHPTRLGFFAPHR